MQNDQVDSVGSFPIAGRTLGGTSPYPCLLRTRSTRRDGPQYTPTATVAAATGLISRGWCVVRSSRIEVPGPANWTFVSGHRDVDLTGVARRGQGRRGEGGFGAAAGGPWAPDFLAPVGSRRSQQPRRRRAGAGLQRPLLRELPQSRRDRRGRSSLEKCRRADGPIRCEQVGGASVGFGSSRVRAALPASVLSARLGGSTPIFRRELVSLHPGFEDADSIILHRFGTRAAYTIWRTQLMSSDDPQPPRKRTTPARRVRAPASADRRKVVHGDLSLRASSATRPRFSEPA